MGIIIWAAYKMLRADGGDYHHGNSLVHMARQKQFDLQCLAFMYPQGGHGQLFSLDQI